MYLVNEYNLDLSEQYLNLLKEVKNLNQKIWDIAKPRYQFNLKNFDGELKTFLGKELFFYNAINTDSFCFRPVFYIKRELYNKLNEQIKNEIKIGYTDIDFNREKDSEVIIYNSISIYGTILIGEKIDHCKLIVSLDDYTIEIPPIGCSMNGIPFKENEIDYESQTSGWWIEGTSIKYFINTFNNNSPKNLKIKVFYKGN